MPNGHPVWTMGFRPFFLLAGATAATLVPLWLFARAGAWDPGYLGAMMWHGHEMVFGFAGAVLAGFFLTAVYNWTGRPHLAGAPLAALAGLWLAGRLAMGFAATMPGWAVAAIDLAFLPAIAITVARPLIAARRFQNMIFLPLLAGLVAANTAFHLDGLGITPGAGQPALVVAVDLLVLFIVMIGGRIIPLFTANAIGALPPRPRKAIEVAAIAGTALVAVLDALPATTTAVAVLCLVLAGVHALRMWGWHGARTFANPILWVLHLGYGWVVVGLALKGLGGLGLMAPSVALHALTIGAVGVLTLGMMSRVALGHTGRPLTVRPVIALAYGAVALAVLARVALPAVAPGAYEAAVHGSATLWTAAFLAFLIIYAPIVTGGRADRPAG